MVDRNSAKAQGDPGQQGQAATAKSREVQMSKYTITHSCGHDVVHQICGTNSHGERERTAEWMAGRLCDECYRAKLAADRLAANSAAAASNAAAKLPALLGSPKQIAWAETIRAKAVGDIDTRLAEAKRNLDRQPYMFRDLAIAAIAGLESIRTKSGAAWWIDHRDDPMAELRNVFSREEILAHIYAA